ncbi:uncharacterized protein METZ01_LOCUS268724, partial [marine metagenome]
ANVIEDNYIYAPDMTYGINLYYCQATSGNEATIVNNLIRVEDYGIQFNQYNHYQNVYYNTVKVRDQYALGGSYYQNQYITVKNNIFSTLASTAAMYFGYQVTGLVSDYNNYNTDSNYPVYHQGNYTLAEWETLGYDSNSVSINPLFVTDSTLVPTNLNLDNLGTPVSGLTDDINGTTRSITTPDMGALEFTGADNRLAAGTYTVGGGGDYATLAAVRQALMSQGIAGAVVFQILSGTYTESIALEGVYGSSATNTITFQSAAANADSVIWENTGSSSSTNYALQLSGTDHVQIKHITFKGDSSSYSRKIVLGGAVDSVTIDSSKFLGYQGGNSNNHASIYGTEIVATGLKIRNNTFTDAGYSAIRLNASSSSSSTGLEITNNTITNTYSGIHLYYFDAVTIRGNTIKGSYMLDFGIYLIYCDGANVIKDNYI